MCWLEETTHKRTHKQDIAMLRWLDPYLRNTELDKINRDLIETTMTNKPQAKPATINRYLALIRSILTKAHREWEWIDKVPPFRMRPEPKHRVRWLSQEEAKRLLSCLPQHLADAAEFTLATGLRQSNCLNLQWSQIDMARKIAWIYADQAKGKKDLAVPLNQSAIKILQRRFSKHHLHVFTYAGKPLKGVDSETWKRTLKKANIKNFRWHDLRHTWATWHIMAGTDLRTLMELGGWSSYEMVLRYAHMSRHRLHDAAHNIDHPQNRCNLAEEVQIQNQ